MEPPPQASPERPCSPLGNHAIWLLVLVGLVLWQGWLTLGLFSAEGRWQSLWDDQPILSGRHPLHLYHGSLGAQSFWADGRLSCFDPAFQAGYPKTPVFDSGSRPAELFLILAGGGYQPAAYKIGLALCCLVVPLLVALTAQVLGLNRACACLAALLGMLVWWGTPCQAALQAGHLNLLLASLAALLQTTLLIRFDRAPGLLTWLGLLLSGYLGWFIYPIFFALLLPLTLVFYLSVGARHRLLWHLALLAALAGALGGNAWWLSDWVTCWWIRAPQRLAPHLLAHRTFHTLWNAPLWGQSVDRLLVLVLFGLAVVGVWRFNQERQRPAARLLGLGAVGFLVLAVGTVLSEPLGDLAMPSLLVPALLFAALPAAHALGEGGRLAVHWAGDRRRGALVAVALLLLVATIARRHTLTLVNRGWHSVPLVVGLNADRLATVAVVKAQTTPEARILWEDRTGPSVAERWSPLLPLLTGRAYLGGLDPEAGIEHAYAGLTDQALVGRPLSEWTDAELEDFSQRYNVGWVVCWSPGAIARFRAWKEAEVLGAVQDQEAGCLFRLRRAPGFALKGQAQWLRADSRRILLGDVVPEDGQVVLSLHYHAGLQASPGRIQVERELDPFDPIPFVRLRLPGPVARITLTWPEP